MLVRYIPLALTTVLGALFLAASFLAPLSIVSATPLAPLTRDPFRPATTPTPSALDKSRPPLQQHPISALSLTAIVTDSKGARFASVEVPSGVGYKVTPGTLIGDQGAKVIEISPTGIVIEELIQGKPTRREIQLRAAQN